MPEGFKIADAYVSVVGEIDRGSVERSAREAGQHAGGSMGAGLVRGLGGAGGSIGSIFTSSVGPYVIAAAAGVGVAMAPALMAGLSGALIGGAGLGIIGLGALLLKEEPALVKAATSLKDKTLSILKGAAKPMLEPFVRSLGMLEGMMKRLEPAFKTAFAALAPAIEPLVKGFTFLVEAAMPGFLKLLEAAGPFLTAIAPSIAGLGAGIGIFAEQIALAGPDAAVFFKDLLMFLSTTIAGLGVFIGWVARGYGEMRRFFTSVSGWVTSTIAWFTMFFTSIGSGIAMVVGFFGSLPGRVIGALMTLVSIVVSAFNNAKNSAINIASGLISGVVNFFAQLPGRARGAVSSLWSAISGAFSSARSNAQNAVTGLVNSVTSFFAQLPGRARGAVSGLWGSISGAFSSAVSGARSQASALVNGAINIINDLPGRARSALAGVRGAVTGAFAGAGGWLVSAGANIIQGLIGGIRSMIGAAVGAAISGMKSIISGAKSALGIGSPSKVFNRQVGRWILPGVTQGVKHTLPAAQRSVATATRALVPGVPGRSATAPSGRGESGYGAAYHFAPGAIVLDASRMNSIADLIAMISGVRTSARAHHARTATAPGV